MYKLKLHPKIRTLLNVLSANIFNNFSSFAITILAARLFGPAEFAKFALAVAVTTNLSSVLDFGTSVALVRLYNVASDDEEKISLLIVINKWKFGLLLLTICFSYPGSKLLAKTLPMLQSTGLLINLAIISGGLLSIWTTTRAIEQAQKKFQAFQKYTLVYGLLRLITALIFLMLNKISNTTIIVSLYFLPLSLLISYRQISEMVSYGYKNVFFTTNEIKLLKSIFYYGVWVGIAGILFSFMYQIPQFILARKTDPTEVGIYSASLTFLPVFLLINDAIRTIILPDVSAIKDAKSRQLFRKRMWQISPIFFGVMITVLIIMSCVQYFLLGQVYKASIPVFLVMGVSTLLAMYLGYSNTLIHSIGIPHVGAVVNMISAVTLTLLSIILQQSAFFMSFILGSVLIFGEVSTYLVVKNIDKDMQ
ncbi:lipopolysaccharide biosynthesis protein [Nostoc parmelioides]|uniref:Oligosaccharide flippase family protein n=1 Tax=Nostoc parmelioides FACHB-3921 TaxID=2692909 RepID=A0ABR8BFC7_9NOSO|nr:oligosaccharide flippase family protein [Nostoc parmelioides]MBD2251575.1 oligosaccharide flippase family protein [Nostoc parmelioides FACHB-3921]